MEARRGRREVNVAVLLCWKQERGVFLGVASAAMTAALQWKERAVTAGGPSCYCTFLRVLGEEEARSERVQRGRFVDVARLCYLLTDVVSRAESSARRVMPQVCRVLSRADTRKLHPLLLLPNSYLISTRQHISPVL
jgi:hypothetical protein